MATHFGVLCKDPKIQESIKDRIRAHVQVVDCTAVITLSATYRLEHDGTPGHVASPRFYFPRVINDQRHVIHGLKASYSGVDGRENVTMVYMDKTKVDEARKNAEDNGRVTTLTDDPENDPYVFKCPLGVISSSTDVLVTVNYSCELPPEGEDTIKLWMPDLALPGQSLKGKLDFSAQIRTKYAVASVESNTAMFKVWTFDNGIVDVGLLNDDEEMDIDINITYKNMTKQPTLSIENPDENSTGLGWMSKTLAMLTVTPDLSDATHATGGALGEYIFVLDRSGSMSGDRIRHARETMLLFLKSLPVGCYFNIIGFGSNYEVLFDRGSQQYNGSTLEKAIKEQKNISANLGGTDLSRPLREIFERLPVVKGYSRQVFVLTDGGIWDTDVTIQLVKNNSKSARLHAFGIGSSADKSLIRRLAEAGGGIHEFVEAFDRTMESKVMEALREAMTACATNLKVEWKLPKGVTAIPISSELLKRPIAEGEHRVIYFDLKGDINGKTSKSTATVTYLVDGMKKSFTVPISIEGCTTKSIKLIHRLAADRKIRELQSSGHKDEATALSTEINMDSDHVTVTCHRVDTDYLVTCIQEKTAAPSRRVSAATAPAPAPAPRRTFGFGAARPGPGTTARQPRVLRDNVYRCLPKNVIKRLSRRGGIARMNGLIHDEVRKSVKEFMTKIIKDSVLHAECARRKTVNVEDVNASLTLNGVKLYGCESFSDKAPRSSGRRRTYTYRRSTPIGRPDVSTASVASVLGPVPSPPPPSKPVLARQRTKDISEVSSNLAQTASTAGSTVRKRKSDASSENGSSAKKQRNMRRSASNSSNASRSRQSSLSKKTSLQRTASNLSSASVIAGSVVTPSMARQNSNVSTTGSHPIKITVSKSASQTKRKSSTVKRKKSSSASLRMLESTTSSTSIIVPPKAAIKNSRKRRISSTDSATESKLMKKDPPHSVAGKSKNKKKKKDAAPIGKKTISRTRSQRSLGTAGPSSGATGKPDFTDMINLITLQTFDGSWDLSKTLAAILGKSVDDLTSTIPMPGLHLKVWATALGLAWLDNHFPQARTEWEMIQFKGMKWINSQNLLGLKVEQLMQSAIKNL